MKGRRLTEERFHAAIQGARSAVLQYARSISRSDADAQDLAQATLLHALMKRHAYRDAGKVEAWLCRIAHNLWVNQLRRDARRGDRNGMARPLGTVRDVSSGEWIEFDAFIDEEAPREPAQVARVAHADLARCLAVLPDEQARVLLLVGAEGHSYGEVAVILSVPIGTVRSRLARGRNALRRMLEGDRPIRASRAYRRRPRTTAKRSKVEERKSRARHRAALASEEV